MRNDIFSGKLANLHCICFAFASITPFPRRIQRHTNKKKTIFYYLTIATEWPYTHYFAPTGDHSCASHTGQSKALQGCRMGVFGEYRHFHSSVGVMTPCMSSSTQDTERLWIPPPQEVEQAVQGLLSHLRLKIKKANDESDGDRLMSV